MASLQQKLNDIQTDLLQAKECAERGVYFELQDARTALIDICNQITQLPKKEAEIFLPLLASLLETTDATAEKVKQAGALQKDEEPKSF